jgi:hypothetical protein
MTGGVSLRQRLGVFSVAPGTFTLITNEFLPVALLTGIRTSLGVSHGAAATMVTVPGSNYIIRSVGGHDRRLLGIGKGFADQLAAAGLNLVLAARSTGN